MAATIGNTNAAGPHNYPAGRLSTPRGKRAVAPPVDMDTPPTPTRTPAPKTTRAPRVAAVVRHGHRGGHHTGHRGGHHRVSPAVKEAKQDVREAKAKARAAAREARQDVREAKAQARAIALAQHTKAAAVKARARLDAKSARRAAAVAKARQRASRGPRITQKTAPIPHHKVAKPKMKRAKIFG